MQQVTEYQHVEKIGDNMELILDGLPTGMSPEHAAQAALAMVEHALPIAMSASGIIIGVARTATLRIGKEVYLLKYSVRMLKVMTAVEIYSEAIAWMQFQIARGRFDKKIANEAIDYIRNEFRKEFPT
jgi:hypothetical protein